MNVALDWLLGLQRIRLADGEAVSLRFAAPPAPWIMLFGAIAAALAVWLVYRREILPTRSRWMLMLLRFGAVMTVLFVCGRPMLVLSRTRVEPSYVALLLDRSSSMSTDDEAIDPEGVPHPTHDLSLNATRSHDPSRWQKVLAKLSEDEDGLLSEIVKKHELGIWTFGIGTARIGDARTVEDTGEILGALETLSPDESRTNLGRAIRQVLRETQGRRVAGVVVISDGRQTEPVEIEPVLAQASARSIPVYAVAAGSTIVRCDAAMTSVWSPEEVFVRDTVSVQYRATLTGIANQTDLTVELRDEATGTLLASANRQFHPPQAEMEGDLQFKPDRVGQIGLVVRIVPLPGERNIENNEARTTLLAHDEKIGVLYVESYPRFEYRYLKNLLLREPNIESSCLLLEATPGFPQEGTLPIRRFPRSVEELRAYDVVILGDVDPRGDWLSPVQQSMLVDFVSLDGGGLIFLAGERNMPRSLRQTPLEKLLPVEIDPRFTGRHDVSLTEPFLPRRTPEGRLSTLLRLEADEVRNEHTYSAMPGFIWYAVVAGVRPGATVLAVHPTARVEAGELPMAVLGRFGVGRTFYSGTDEWWRWRQYSGDIYYDTIWLQIIRTLARGKKLGCTNPWRLETDQRRYELGDEVRVRLSLQDDSPAAQLPEAVITVRDASNLLVGRLSLRPPPGTNQLWQGEFVPRSSGNLSLTASAPHVPGRFGTAGSRTLTRSITVAPHDPEQARLEADHELLRLVAGRTGGSFYQLSDDLKQLAAVLADRSVQIADDVEEPIWDTWLILILLFVLLSTEWALRRARGLA